MHIYHLDKWQPAHDFHVDYHTGEKRSWLVLSLTAITMIAEIVAGTLFHSMALLADGWHMATHVAAFAITLFAYQYARKHAQNPEFTFGTGKVSVLGGFASAVALAVVALMMAVESMMRIISPLAIQFNEAIFVAVIGLIVNAVSVVLLHHDEDHHHTDHNLRAAYFHVLADTLTSVLAIVALVLGKYFGWIRLDALMGIIGAGVITKWAVNLIKNTSRILLDRSIEPQIKTAIIKRIENDQDNRVVDFHAWHDGANQAYLVLSLVTHYPQSPEYYKKLFADIGDFSHITVEVHPCEGSPCIPAEPSIP